MTRKQENVREFANDEKTGNSWRKCRNVCRYPVSLFSECRLSRRVIWKVNNDLLCTHFDNPV